jgi:hypothetical protein
MDWGPGCLELIFAAHRFAIMLEVMRKHLFGLLFLAGFVIFAYYLIYSNSRDKAFRLQLSKSSAKLKSLPEIVRAVSGDFKARTHFKALSEKAGRKIDVRKIMRDDDYCALIRIKDKIDGAYIGFFTKNLLDERNIAESGPEEERAFEALLLGLSAKSGEGAANAFHSRDDEILRFFNALLLGNLLDGVNFRDADLRASESLLAELTRERPQNGALFYFLANVREKLNFPPAQVKETVRSALLAPEFDTFVLWISQQIWGRGLNSLTQLVAARILISKVPIPNYNAPYFTLRKYVNGDNEMAVLAIDFGRRLMREGIQLGPDLDEFVYWLAIEHAIGRSIYLKAWPLAHGGEPPEKAFAASYKDILKKGRAKEHLYPEDPLFQRISRSQSYCPREALEKVLWEKKREFLNFRAHQTHRIQ